MNTNTSTITTKYRFKHSTSLKLPLFLNAIPCGFPSPADDYVDRDLDLNEYIVRHPASTFFLKAQGKSMIDASINEEDILVVDKSLEAKHNDIVIASLNGEFTIKRLVKQDGKVSLLPCNSDFNPVTVRPDDDLVIWGVVTHIIHALQ
ncbi:MAG: translesion error-prone DNA polymerase V autoproteolytic subunit [Candidatus Dojkabacteria bacterium]